MLAADKKAKKSPADSRTSLIGHCNYFTACEYILLTSL